MKAFDPVQESIIEDEENHSDSYEVDEQDFADEVAKTVAKIPLGKIIVAED